MSENSAQTAPATMRLLLVEDNPIFADQLTNAIQKLPQQWNIVSCETGDTAIKELENNIHNFDLALIDLGLPDIDGIDVIRACRKFNGEAPIVVISVISAERSVLEAIHAGATGYILKHESMDHITAAIDQVMKGIYPLSPSLARYLFNKINKTHNENRPIDDFKLTPREFQTLAYLSEGYTYDEVAKLMKVATTTIQWNVRQIYRKLNVHSQVQAINKARKYNLI